MDEQQIQEIADRIAEALEDLSPGEPSWWEPWAAFGGYAAILAALVAFGVGARSIHHQKKALKTQQDALAAQIKDAAAALEQKREADSRSEWWRRTQWALEAASSGQPDKYGYGSEILDQLAKSNLAHAEDKRLLDSVWEVTSTEMRDDSIEQLLEDAQNQENLTPEELESLRSYFSHVDAPPGSEDNGEGKKEETDGDPQTV